MALTRTGWCGIGRFCGPADAADCCVCARREPRGDAQAPGSGQGPPRRQPEALQGDQGRSGQACCRASAHQRPADRDRQAHPPERGRAQRHRGKVDQLEVAGEEAARHAGGASRHDLGPAGRHAAHGPQPAAGDDHAPRGCAFHGAQRHAAGRGISRAQGAGRGLANNSTISRAS